jgi:hypothetical protein
VPARVIALLLMLALLPSAELVEQAAHVIEHVVGGEAAGHDAHHESHDPADEHGCTGLVHVCGAHHGAGIASTASIPLMASRHRGLAAVIVPSDLHDLAATAPPHRPPIA